MKFLRITGKGYISVLSYQSFPLLAFWFKLNGSHTMGNQYFVVANTEFTLGHNIHVILVGDSFEGSQERLEKMLSPIKRE